MPGPSAAHCLESFVAQRDPALTRMREAPGTCSISARETTCPRSVATTRPFSRRTKPRWANHHVAAASGTVSRCTGTPSAVAAPCNNSYVMSENTQSSAITFFLSSSDTGAAGKTSSDGHYRTALGTNRFSPNIAGKVRSATASQPPLKAASVDGRSRTTPTLPSSVSSRATWRPQEVRRRPFARSSASPCSQKNSKAASSDRPPCVPQSPPCNALRFSNATSSGKSTRSCIELLPRCSRFRSQHPAGRIELAQSFENRRPSTTCESTSVQEFHEDQEFPGNGVAEKSGRMRAPNGVHLESNCLPR
ncbi:hypothetical protein VT03_01005 [Planctomyces sp. SH-PL14]|nr:hypothetical protein VT03_01005 [Planctomyces sp. SH-PL14]